MRSDGQRVAGNARRSVPDRSVVCGVPALVLALALSLCAGEAVVAQELYKYRGENGEWIFSDRPPDDGQTIEVRELEKGSADATVDVNHRFVGSNVELVASNDFYAPVELRLEIAGIRGLSYPDLDQSMVWVLPPRSESSLFQLQLLEDGTAPFLEYGFRYMPGDPAANVVRILHDDGSYAIYAHLNTNTVRVRLGDRVDGGDYIADSGHISRR